MYRSQSLMIEGSDAVYSIVGPTNHSGQEHHNNFPANGWICPDYQSLRRSGL